MKDIIDSLKIRLNSPIIISFIISWPFWNWEIVIGLLLYKPESLQKYLGCNNYVDLINHYWNLKSGIYLPLISAMGYVIFFPLLKYIISRYSTYVSTKEQEMVLKIAKVSVVPTTEYVQAVEESDVEIKRLSEIIKEKSKVIEEKNHLLTENSILQTELQGSKNEVNYLTETSSSLKSELEKTRNDVTHWNNEFQKADSQMYDALRKADKLKIDNNQIPNLKKEIKELNIKLEKVHSAYDEKIVAHEAFMYITSEDFLNGSWNLLIIIHNENGESYETTLSFSGKVITNQTYELCIFFTGLKFYIYDPINNKAAISFNVELNLDNLNFMTEEIKKDHERIFKALSDNLIGSLNNEQKSFHFEGNSGIKVIMSKV